MPPGAPSWTEACALEPRIQALANELIDGFVRDGRADLASRVAFPLPGAVISMLLGIPESDWPKLKKWSIAEQALMLPAEPVERLVECAHEFMALQHYFRDQILSRAKEPREDLLTLMVPIETGGTAPLSMQEAVCCSSDLLAAGHETATGLIGNGMALRGEARTVALTQLVTHEGHGAVLVPDGQWGEQPMSQPVEDDRQPGSLRRR